MSILQLMIGKWKHDRDSDDDDLIEVLMQGLGLPLAVARKTACSSPIINISQNGDVYCIQFDIEKQSFVATFKIGQPFDEMTNPMGMKRKSLAYIDDEGRLVMKAVDPKDTFISIWNVQA
ncbi:cellular retinoic acid-binding protein 2-like [Saccoglossus kowalevskii]|uniref:14 kDa fatty acid-binding protein-like n=1 Tax=Saccoglossus kowalevskii TaxID=10224 RepID=A0ABM0MW36_SACKO|nr:PREDICTED: 14 kDa fatty acid-binding protein-like [Saccoglossus kowalevskii]